MLVTVCATIVAIFLIFGTVLLHSGGGETFIEIATKLSGNYRGGPAKIAVIASGLFGMLSGSPVANVATTGNFTIPLMKKVGYRPYTAGAIEAAASTGGLMVPPVMGAAAFVMAELLGISYLQVCIYAIIPAILFYVSLFCFVHFQAIRRNIQPTGEVHGSYKDFLVWSKLGPLFFPLISFIFILTQGFTAMFSAFCAVLISFACFVFKDLSREGIITRAKFLPKLLSEGGKAVAYIIPLILCAQLVVGMLGQSGLGVELASFITAIGAHYKFLALIMAAVLTILMGMGVPPVGAYVLAVSVAGPALINLEVDPVAAHMFCFNFASFAPITPPVCAAVYVGASIAEAPWLRTGIQAVKIAAVAYIVPFSYSLAKSPYLLCMGSTWLVLLYFVCAVVGTVCLAGAMVGAMVHGHLSAIPRILLGLGGAALLINLGWHYTVAGAAMVAIGLTITLLFDREKSLQMA